jgi:hypothetical protein
MVVHLHWSRNPKLVRETTLGITVCGVKAPHEQLTAHLPATPAWRKHAKHKNNAEKTVESYVL